jgi:hypothetical protein
MNQVARTSHHKVNHPQNEYIVNGQIDLPPSQRQSPLVSSPEDISEFGEQDGLIIWTLDLFQALKTLDTNDLPKIREEIRNTKGKWR